MDLKIKLILKQDNKNLECDIETTYEEFSNTRVELSKDLSYFFKDLNKTVSWEKENQEQPVQPQVIVQPMVQNQNPVCITENQIKFIQKYLKIVPDPNLSYDEAFNMIKDYKIRNGWKM